MPRSVPWIVMAMVLTTAMVVGARARPAPPSLEERVRRITSEIRCPTCRSQSVADSEAPAAIFITDEVRDRLRAGQSDETVREYVFSRYGDEIRLRPGTRGVAVLVWLLPVVGVAAAVVVLVFAFRRWRPRGRARVSDADRERVERALRA